MLNNQMEKTGKIFSTEVHIVWYRDGARMKQGAGVGIYRRRLRRIHYCAR